MKILVCIGTRPEAIKMAPICYELHKKNIPYKLCVTAQHRELLDQVIDFFQLKVDYDLDLMRKNQNLNFLSSKILFQMDAILDSEIFDLVIVHGDTTTSSMVALAAFHRQIKVMHIEAGLRTYNKHAPFPEEINRQLTGRLSDYHMAPTFSASKNLLEEGVKEKDILITGNSVIDALKFTRNKLAKGYSNPSIENLKNLLDLNSDIILVTGHRRENIGQGYINVCNAILELSKNDLQIVFPVHYNPNVRQVVFDKLKGIANIHLIEPLDYPSFVWLMKKAKVIISDSGGIQEEAPTFNIPVLVTREVTERLEGVLSGHSFLVGTNTSKIIDKTLELLSSTKFDTKVNPYGSGKAAELIVNFIKDYFK
ncbi:non-hydrolyzing UDP-N-acetylglucosamine 2-epimerase [Ichthyenterobacterium magnum]|uniref:UDP-N-acetylglucosamine 2-epimerase (non-hydrolyzing) n=1 Tax=Ichthyenterobacterium magnum TaxID=1230530 RepID=A0A420DUI7_9FLAO|nr:UDP-N-acetylglucosamine 2-epimerase (non-hydrolyzing) [Ichthyenterobacterium magnum]RKE97984.1 UDP-N-acetylglucosamine 2-epimerase [Ichthyenterobacterium magnum]